MQSQSWIRQSSASHGEKERERERKSTIHRRVSISSRSFFFFYFYASEPVRGDSPSALSVYSLFFFLLLLFADARLVRGGFSLESTEF